MSDETPRFRLIKGGRLDFSTDQLRAIDAILRERLQPITRYGWVIDPEGTSISTCGAPVTELTAQVREAVRQSERMLQPRKILPSAMIPPPPPETLPCTLVMARIDPLGVLVATCGAEITQDYNDTLLAIADLLGPIFESARVTA